MAFLDRRKLKVCPDTWSFCANSKRGPTTKFDQKVACHLWFLKLVHCAKNNLNFRIETEPATAGADETVQYSICVRYNRVYMYYVFLFTYIYSYLGCYVKMQIIFLVKCGSSSARVFCKPVVFKKYAYKQMTSAY